MHYRHRFPTEIISHAVWLYHAFSLSLREVELILAERGSVSFETVRRWCKKFRATLADRLRRRPRVFVQLIVRYLRLDPQMLTDSLRDAGIENIPDARPVFIDP